MSEIHIAIDIPPVLTGSPIPVTVNLRLTALEEQVGVTGSTDPLSVENRLTVAQEDIVTAQDTIDAHIADVANPHNVTKAQVELGNVDNTSDINKPVSTAQAAADAAVLAASEPEGASAAAVSAHATGTGVHTIASTTGLQTALDSKSGTAHDHTGVYDLEGAAAAAQAAAIAASAPAANGVTGGDAHAHTNGQGAQIDYANLSGKPTLGSASALDVGTTANKIVQLDGAGRLPPVDGSQLTGISGGSATQAFGTISVSGQSNVVADSAPDTLTIVGVGAVITTDAATDTITITAEAAGAAASAQSAAIAAAEADATSKANAAQAASAPAAKGVTNGDSHDHSGGDGGTIAYSSLSGKPTLGTAAATAATAYEAAGVVATHAALTTTHGTSSYGATLVGAAAASDARTTLGLGGSATLSVGTVAGTVAAGDDLRIVSAASEKFVASIGCASLVVNGNGSMQDNTNFTSWTFDQVDCPEGSIGSFLASGSVEYKNNNKIYIDPNLTYTLYITAKSGDIGGANYSAGNKQFIGVALYDIDGLSIQPNHATKYSGSTDTTLSAQLNPGDTTVSVVNAAGWHAGTYPDYSQFVWYGYANAFGHVYPDYSYTRYGSNSYSGNSSSGTWLAGGISGNVITLRVPWAGPTVPAGTAVRNAVQGGTYKYICLYNATVPDYWVTYKGSIGGLSTASLTNAFFYGTAYLKIVHLVNSGGTPTNKVRIANVSFTTVSSANLESSVGVGSTYQRIATSSLPVNGLAVEGNAGFGTSTPSAKLHVVNTGEQFRFGYDSNNYLSSTIISSGAVAYSLVGTSASIKWLYRDATTNTVYNLATFSKGSTGAGGAGLGTGITLAAKSSTTEDVPQVTLSSSWVVATHATRTARGALSAVDYNGTREAFSWKADGTQILLGFFGGPEVAKPTSMTTQLTTITYTSPGTPDYDISDVTQTTPFGFTTADEARTVLAVIKNTQDRVGQLETKLRALSLLT